MSIVGPRPLTQDDVTRLGWDDTEHRKRWDVTPGITGLVQIYGGTSATHSWELEQVYMVNKSFVTDLKIICLSAIVNVSGKKRAKKWFPLKTH
jgi:lipopolysaccharide/colanic/teichoic acid biosynthesis glycosyltransferase